MLFCSSVVPDRQRSQNTFPIVNNPLISPVSSKYYYIFLISQMGKSLIQSPQKSMETVPLILMCFGLGPHKQGSPQKFFTWHAQCTAPPGILAQSFFSNKMEKKFWVRTPGDTVHHVCCVKNSWEFTCL